MDKGDVEVIMVKIDIISGFLGAGKTTLIKKLLQDAFKGQQVVLIENEFGEIGIDGGFLKDAGIEIKEMNSGCICCSLVGDFGTALKEVVEKYHPDRIVIEPSGVGKLSDVIHAVENLHLEADGEVKLNSAVTVVDVLKCKMYLKNFGEFFKNQVEAAGTIILSRTDTKKATPEKIEAAIELIRELNPDATIITTPVEDLGGQKILDTIEGMKIDLSHVEEEHDHCCDHEHHHDHDHDEHDEHEHHHHHHDGEECDDPECECHHHHHHHADDVFSSWGKETPKKFSKEALEDMLHKLDSGDYGHILRAKGIVNGEDGWLEFDYVPEEHEVRAGHPDYTGRLCVIGAELKEDGLAELFGV